MKRYKLIARDAGLVVALLALLTIFTTIIVTVAALIAYALI